jgi:hypothetical protein
LTGATSDTAGLKDAKALLDQLNAWPVSSALPDSLRLGQRSRFGLAFVSARTLPGEIDVEADTAENFRSQLGSLPEIPCPPET